VRGRLWEHKHARIKTIGKFDHWSIHCLENNLPQLCAISVLGGRIKDDLESAGSTTCYLSNFCEDGINFPCATDSAHKDLFGCYLVWDTKELRWIRSGKAYGENDSTIGSRWTKDHTEGAKLQTAASRKSRFYRSYPCRIIGQSMVDVKERRGFFQDLKPRIGFAFDSANVDTLVSEESGLFAWDSHAIESLRNSNDNCIGIESKKLNMISYMLEKMDDLMIPECSNISDSFGIEKYLGCFSK
jgi:hypothetical protein